MTKKPAEPVVEFIYLGQEDTEQYGYQFSDGKPTVVSDKHAIEKLSKNRFFEMKRK